MAAEANNFPASDDDLNTTAPQAKPSEWKMPEPVFRRSSGRLPKGFEKEGGEVEAFHESAPPTISTSEASPIITAEPKPKSPALKLLVVVLAVAGMIAFLIVFLTVVYLFFMRDASAPPPT